VPVDSPYSVITPKDVAESLILDFGTSIDYLTVRTRSQRFNVDPDRVTKLIGLAQVKVTWDE
jgi:hypothetical protein